MKINGQMVICDRCGAEIFRRWIGEKTYDGGWTHVDSYEQLPDGWGLVAVPNTVKEATTGNVYNKYLEVCPDCQKVWQRSINEGFLKGSKLSEKGGEEDGAKSQAK